MLNPAYAFTHFQTKFSEKRTLKQSISFLQGSQNMDFSVDFVSRGLCFDFKNDAFLGECHAIIMPKMHLNGELYVAPCWEDIKVPSNGLAGFEGAFLSALKKSVEKMQREIF